MAANAGTAREDWWGRTYWDSGPAVKADPVPARQSEYEYWLEHGRIPNLVWYPEDDPEPVLRPSGMPPT
jgi:hypothetical protein